MNQRQMESYRDRREYLNKRGLCIRCGLNPQASGRLHCLECLDRQVIYGLGRYDNAKQNGLCVSCAKNPVKPGTTMCTECAKKNYASFTRLRAKRIAAGVCIRCGKIKILGTGFKLCPVCRQKNAEYSRRAGGLKRSALEGKKGLPD